MDYSAAKSKHLQNIEMKKCIVVSVPGSLEMAWRVGLKIVAELRVLK